MSYSGRATFDYDEADDVWLVEFPSLPGCLTYGATLEEARHNAREVLQLWLEQDEVVVEEDIRPRQPAAG